MILNPETDRRNWTLLNFNFLCCLGYDCFHIMMSSSPNPVVSFNGKNTNHYMATKTSYIHHQISNLPGNPTKNDHFGVFWGYHHLRKHPYFLQVFCYQETRRSDRRPWGHPPKKKSSFPDKTNPLGRTSHGIFYRNKFGAPVCHKTQVLVGKWHAIQKEHLGL